MNAHKSIWLGVACLVSKKKKITQGNEINNNNRDTDTLNRGAELSPRSVHATVRAAHWTLCAQPAQKFTTPKSKLCQAEIDVQLSDSFCCSANASRLAMAGNWRCAIGKCSELVVEPVQLSYSNIQLGELDEFFMNLHRASNFFILFQKILELLYIGSWFIWSNGV